VAASGAFGLASTAFGAAGAAGAAAGVAAGGARGGPPPFAFWENVPLLTVECAGGLGGLIFCTAFLRGQGLCRRSRRKRGKTRHRNGAQQSCLNGHPWSPWGIGYLETTHPSAATARDNGAIDGWVKYSDGESTARRLHSSAVQPRSARLRPSS